MVTAAAVHWSGEQVLAPEPRLFEVRASSASLFSTLVSALIESLIPDARVIFREADASIPLRPSDVLLTCGATGRTLVVFGAVPDRQLVAAHFAAGTRSMIGVDASREELSAAVSSIVEGPAFFASGVVNALASASEKTASSGLTHREQEIIGFVVEGLSNREIAERLCLSSNTIRTHLQSASGKLGVRSRARLAARARTLGIA